MRWAAGGATALLDSQAHRAELAAESDRLLRFFERSEGADRFAWRTIDGTVDASKPLALYNVARLVHCFGIAHLLGHPRAGQWAEDGIRMLRDRFADPDAVGFVDAIAFTGGTVAEHRTTYGHAFALLAGATGMQAGIPGAAEILGRATTTIDALLWRDDVGAAVDAVTHDGRVREEYRGQNANMHLTEAYLAAYEFDGRREWLQRAQRLARRLVVETVPQYDGRIPEHYGPDWTVDAGYGRDTPFDAFRPFGTMPGHAVEWARLLLNIAAYTGDETQMLDGAKTLYDGAIRDGRRQGVAGLAYTVDVDGTVVNDARMHWVAAEALGAAAWLARTTGEQTYTREYADRWTDITTYFVDRRGGSWWHELDVSGAPASTTWDGKPDLYHAYQATFAARLARPCGLALAARDGSVLQTPPAATTDPTTRTETDS